jgi:hypothetical protein
MIKKLFYLVSALLTFLIIILICRVVSLENENKELNSHLKYLTKENKELMRTADILGAEALRLIIKLEEQEKDVSLIIK